MKAAVPDVRTKQKLISMKYLGLFELWRWMVKKILTFDEFPLYCSLIVKPVSSIQPPII